MIPIPRTRIERTDIPRTTIMASEIEIINITVLHRGVIGVKTYIQCGEKWNVYVPFRLSVYVRRRTKLAEGTQSSTLTTKSRIEVSNSRQSRKYAASTTGIVDEIRPEPTLYRYTGIMTAMKEMFCDVIQQNIEM